MGATSASAQQPNACSNGIAVTNPSDNPGLVQDCQTLLTLKDALAGEAQLNWSANAAIDTWRGVAVSGSPARVTSINLANGGLTGVIPAQLGSLPGLTTLYLHRNQLTGAIPSELGSLSNLQGLYIQRNQLTGEIPAQLGDLSNLTRLYLSNNGFTGCIPAALRDVQHSDVGSAGLPFCAENTPAPTPEPEQDSGCSNGIAVPNPEDNPDLVRDCEILLSAKDALRGDAPLNWSADSSIWWWTGVGIRRTGGGVARIEFSPWGSNSYNDDYIPLQGVIPPQFGNLSSLEVLNLRENQLTGEIPAELGKLSSLEMLGLRENQLTGEIPAELSKLSGLEVLFLIENRLTGEIPAELGKLSSLEVLGLRENQLTGEIPAELGKLSNLRYMTLAGNQLSGCFPSHTHRHNFSHDFFHRPYSYYHFKSYADNVHFCDKDTLTAFYNATNGESWTNNDNWLSNKPLGEWHGVTTDADGRVTALSLRDNNLVGEIPPILVQLDKLEVLALDGNSLSGKIPWSFDSLRNLTRLALNRNDLEGGIPSSLWYLENLSVLGLARNEDMSGPIPAWLGTRLSNLTKLSLHDTGLSGQLPTELTNLNLSRLAIRNTGLCAPPDDEFQTWLAGIEDTDFGDDGPTVCLSLNGNDPASK